MDDAKDLIAKLRRAHRMSVSDPTDTSRTTLYSQAADALEAVRADAWDEGCAARPMQVVAETERGPMYSMHADNPYRSEKQ